MKNINKILILFFIVIGVAIYGTWEFLQSEWVASRISSYATKYVEEMLNADIEFENLQFKLFPPGAELREVKFKGEKESVGFRAEVNKLGIYFNPLDVFSTSFSVDNIKLEDGYLDLQFNDGSTKLDNSDGKSNSKPFEISNVFNVLKDIPINSIELSHYILKINDNKLETSYLLVKNEKSHIETTGKISNIQLQELTTKPISIDELNFDASVNPQTISLKKIVLRKDLGQVGIEGTVVNYLTEQMQYKLTVDSKLPLMMINDIIDFSKVGRIYSGYADTNIRLNGKGKVFEALATVNAFDVDSDFAYGEDVKALVRITPEQIKFENVNLKYKEQEVVLKKPFEFFNLITKKWVEEPVVVVAKSLRTDNFLRFLGDKVDLIKGAVSGEIRFVLGENYYTFFTGEGVKIDHLELIPGGTKIFRIENLNMDYGNFHIKENVFTMDMIASEASTSINLKGEISKDKFLLKMPEGNISLDKFSPIVNFNIGGEGKLGFQLERVEDNKMVMNLSGDFKDLYFEDYWLDELETDLVFDFSSSNISIRNLAGKSNKSMVAAKGLINYLSKDIDIKFSINDLNFSESKRIFRNVLKDVKYSSNEIHGKWDIAGALSGKMTSEDIRIDGNFTGINNYFFKESLDTFKFSFVLDDQIIRLKDFVAKKASGTLYSFVEYNLRQSTADIWMKISDLPVAEVSYYARSPLALQGQINGSVNLKYANNQWNGEGSLLLQESNVQAESYPDSSLNIMVKDSKVAFDFNGFGKQILLGANINLDDIKIPSSTKVDLNITDIRKIIGAFKGVDVANTDLEGSVNYSMYSEFMLPDFLITKVQSNLKRLVLNKKPITVDYKNNNPEVIVENGVIEKWDVNVRGRNFYILSKGEGDFHKDYDVTTNTKIDASIIEILNSFVSKANGNIRGKLVYKSMAGKEEYQALLTSNNLALNTKLLPTSITKADMRLSFEDSVLKIEKFLAKLISGSFELVGEIDIENLIPDINIRFGFKDAGLTIMKKSNLVFSGNGSLVGKTFPYTLGGDFYIQRFNLINELADFGGDGAIVSQSDIKYLPGAKKKAADNLLDLNLNVLTREPIYITNSIADLGFLGNLQLTGGEKDPRITGKISLAPRKNKVTFKNNEFVFSKGNIFFNDRNDYKNPELDFLAQATIGDHKVNVKVLGPVKNFDMGLYSEPTLPQSDILSLIAFGYTEDLSNSLSDQDKESMTRASIGSILFDSFKINETLKNEFGIQVNLGTAITEQERSYLSQRNAEGSDDSRVRSATTFELRKQLSDSMSLSVSSTVGTSTSQRQSLNLNYNVNKKLSLQGVYESRQTDETETINNDTSFGGDVKMRWTFK